MAASPRDPRGGGIFIVLGAGIGTAIGAAIGQHSAGLVFGVVAGAAIAIVYFLKDRR